MKKYFLLTATLFACFSIKAQTVLNGDYKITGQLQIEDKLDVTNITANTVKSVLARLSDETTLEIRAFDVMPVFGKLFSIENYFY